MFAWDKNEIIKKGIAAKLVNRMKSMNATHLLDGIFGFPFIYAAAHENRGYINQLVCRRLAGLLRFPS